MAVPEVHTHTFVDVVHRLEGRAVAHERRSVADHASGRTNARMLTQEHKRANPGARAPPRNPIVSTLMSPPISLP